MGCPKMGILGVLHAVWDPSETGLALAPRWEQGGDHVLGWGVTGLWPAPCLGLQDQTLIRGSPP